MAKRTKTRRTVFAVIGVWDYEGTELLGVFSTKRGAENFVSKRTERTYDNVTIETVRLNERLRS